MKNSTSEKLKKFIQEQGLTIKEFETRCGLSNGYVNNIRRNIGRDALERIIEQFPMLDIEWLLESNEQTEDYSIDFSRLISIMEKDHQLIRDMMEKKDDTIDRLLSIMEADRNIKKEKSA